MYNDDDRMRFCPYFEKEIDMTLCDVVKNCGEGWFNKSLCPEVTDWDKAIRICSKCPHQFD